MRAFVHLSDDYRQIIVLVDIEVFQYGVFAKILGLPIGTIMYRLSQVHAALYNLAKHARRSPLRDAK